MGGGGSVEAEPILTVNVQHPDALFFNVPAFVVALSCEMVVDRERDLLRKLDPGCLIVVSLGQLLPLIETKSGSQKSEDER